MPSLDFAYAALLLAGEVNANLLGHPFPHTTLRIHEFEEVSAEMLRPI